MRCGDGGQAPSPAGLYGVLFLEPNVEQVVLKKRLDVASELLVTTSDSIEFIAQSVGFKNKNSFYREFKKRFGKTPKEYRQIKSV